MTIQVETYETPEVASDLTPECDQAAMDLIAKLGLKGQESLIVERRETGEAERNPYRHMTQDEGLVYGILMPVRTKIEDYNAGGIPLRVLQVAAHAKELGLPQLWVWHPEGSVREDPILVADKNAWQSQRWLLARWGDCLLPFDQLRTAAIARAREVWAGAVRESLSKLNAELSAIEQMDPRKLLQKAANPLSVYVNL